MNINTAKKCFSLFADCIKDKLPNCEMPNEHEIKYFTTDQLKSNAQVLFMRYIVSTNHIYYNDTTVAYAYKQLMNILNENIFAQYEQQIFELVQQNDELKVQIKEYKEIIFEEIQNKKLKL